MRQALADTRHEILAQRSIAAHHVADQVKGAPCFAAIVAAFKARHHVARFGRARFAVDKC